MNGVEQKSPPSDRMSIGDCIVDPSLRQAVLARLLQAGRMKPEADVDGQTGMACGTPLHRGSLSNAAHVVGCCQGDVPRIGPQYRQARRRTVRARRAVVMGLDAARGRSEGVLGRSRQHLISMGEVRSSLDVMGMCDVHNGHVHGTQPRRSKVDVVAAALTHLPARARSARSRHVAYVRVAASFCGRVGAAHLSDG